MKIQTFFIGANYNARKIKKQYYYRLEESIFLFCLRAIVFVPEIDALEWLRANDIGTGFVGWAVLLQIPGHRRLSPLGAVHRRRQWQMFTLQSYVVEAT